MTPKSHVRMQVEFGMRKVFPCWVEALPNTVRRESHLACSFERGGGVLCFPTVGRVGSFEPSQYGKRHFRGLPFLIRHRDDKLIACATFHRLGRMDVGCCCIHKVRLCAVLGHHTSLLDVLCAFAWRRCRPLRDKAAIKMPQRVGSSLDTYHVVNASSDSSCDPFSFLRLTEEREKPLICSSRG